MIEGADPAAEPIELSSRLVLRSSTGPPPPRRPLADRPLTATRPVTPSFPSHPSLPIRKGQRCLHQFNRRKFLIGTAAAATSAWLLAACSSGDSGTGGTPQASASAIPQADIDKALDTETTLTFWTWVPDITNQVDLFTKAYPKIKVNIVNVGQGAPHYQKLRTAIQAGQGGPDVAQMEFQFITVVHAG